MTLASAFCSIGGGGGSVGVAGVGFVACNERTHARQETEET